jgi:hypothetical protein
MSDVPVSRGGMEMMLSDAQTVKALMDKNITYTTSHSLKFSIDLTKEDQTERRMSIRLNPDRQLNGTTFPLISITLENAWSDYEDDLCLTQISTSDSNFNINQNKYYAAFDETCDGQDEQVDYEIWAITMIPRHCIGKLSTESEVWTAHQEMVQRVIENPFIHRLRVIGIEPIKNDSNYIITKSKNLVYYSIYHTLPSQQQGTYL